MSNQIYSVIPAIISEIEAVGRDHRNEAQKYTFRSIDDVYNAANKAIAKHKATITPSYIILENEVNSVTDQYGKQKNVRQVVLQGNYRVFAEDGSFIDCCTIGEANDTSDKAFNKAMSAAYKYFMFQTFIIPTEEPKDSENESPPVIPKPNVQDKTKINDALKPKTNPIVTLANKLNADKINPEQFYKVNKLTTNHIKEITEIVSDEAVYLKCIANLKPANPAEKINYIEAIKKKLIPHNIDIDTYFEKNSLDILDELIQKKIATDDSLFKQYLAKAMK